MRMIVLVLAALAQHVAAAEHQVFVPSDPRARHVVMESTGPIDQRVLVTRREGPSGTTYAVRLFNCSNGTWKYLGSGDSVDEAKAGVPDRLMADILPNSIPAALRSAACSRT